MPSKLRVQFRTFSESAKPIVKLMDDMDADVANALGNSMVRDKHAAVRNASVVLLSGFLESFLKQSAEAFFDELRSRGIRYSELPQRMRKVHFSGGLSEIQKIAKDDDDVFSDTQVALGRLAGPSRDDVASLYWQAFAVTKGNPGSVVVKEYLKNFDIKNPLNALAVEVSSDETLIDMTLDSFISLRNECAHTGRAKNTPKTSEVRDFVFFLRRLTLGISRVLERTVSDLYARALAAR